MANEHSPQAKTQELDWKTVVEHERQARNAMNKRATEIHQKTAK